MPERDERPLRTLLVALVVCAVCSVLVSTSAALLRPLQRANRERERQAKVVELIERQPGLKAMLDAAEDGDVREVVVELASGDVADWADPAEVAAARADDPASSAAIPADRDLAGIGRRPLLSTAYVVRESGRLALVLLPVYGRGYDSTIRGYVALDEDANTVRGVTFYEHGETPGVGGEVLGDEEWLGAWIGRRVRDADGRLRIGTSLRELGPDDPDAAFQVDVVSGATKTSGGVGNLLRFWLGDDGFGPFLQRLAAGEVPR